MNNSDSFPNDPILLTVADYARRFDISENTVRTRINRKKIKTVKRMIDGRETILIEVEPFVDHSVSPIEQFGIVQQTVRREASDPLEQSEQSGELIDFMRETFRTVQGYAGQIVELARENERYKLLTDTSTRTRENLEKEIEQLKMEVFTRDARIKELEQSLSMDNEQYMRLKELEEKLANNETENQKMAEQLEVKKNKSLFSRFFKK